MTLTWGAWVSGMVMSPGAARDVRGYDAGKRFMNINTTTHPRLPRTTRRIAPPGVADLRRGLLPCGQLWCEVFLFCKITQLRSARQRRIAKQIPGPSQNRTLRLIKLAAALEAGVRVI